MSSLDQTNTANRLQKGLSEVDQNNADVLHVEQSIYRAIALANSDRRWTPRPIAPLAEPADLNALVGDDMNGATAEARFQAGRIDTLYISLNRVANTIKAQMDTVEKSVTDASTELQDVLQQSGAESKQYLWVADSFNNSTFVDNSKSTALVDTDYGMATLGLQDFRSIDNFSMGVDLSETRGIPGCNMLVLDEPFTGTDVKEPQVLTESADTLSLGNLTDSDPSTWFEIERNFVAPKQKLKMFGRAWHYSEAGEEKDVWTALGGLDWDVFVQWGTLPVDQGIGDKGIPIAEWLDLDQELQAGADPSKFAVRLALEVVLDSPTQITALKLTPFQIGRAHV